MGSIFLPSSYRCLFPYRGRKFAVAPACRFDEDSKSAGAFEGFHTEWMPSMTMVHSQFSTIDGARIICWPHMATGGKGRKKFGKRVSLK